MRQSDTTQTPEVKALNLEKRSRLLLSIASALPQAIPVQQLSDERLIYWQDHRAELHRGIKAVLLGEISPAQITFEVPEIKIFRGSNLFKVNLNAPLPIAEAEWFPHDMLELENFIERNVPSIVLTESFEDRQFSLDSDLGDILGGWTVLRSKGNQLYFAHAYTFLRQAADPVRRYAFKNFSYRGGFQKLYASFKGRGWKIKFESNPTGPGD